MNFLHENFQDSSGMFQGLPTRNLITITPKKIFSSSFKYSLSSRYSASIYSKTFKKSFKNNFTFFLEIYSGISLRILPIIPSNIFLKVNFRVHPMTDSEEFLLTFLLHLFNGFLKELFQALHEEFFQKKIQELFNDFYRIPPTIPV